MKQSEIDQLLNALYVVKFYAKCDGIKVYYQDENKYCIKCVANGKVIDHARKGKGKWDLKTDKKNS